MKKFMTMSAFFLSAACLSVHTPSFASGLFGDIISGAEKASQSLMKRGSSHHDKLDHATKLETMPNQSSQAPDGTETYGQLIGPTATSVTSQDALLAPSTESPTASPATSDTSQPALQSSNPGQKERPVRSITAPNTNNPTLGPPAPSYMTEQ